MEHGKEGVGVRLPLTVVELNADEPSGQERSPRWLAALWLTLLATMAVGLLVFWAYLERPGRHPEFYGDYRGGYARGLDLRATGHTYRDCEGGLHEPYAAARTFALIQAKAVYLHGCWRGARGKSIGDYVRRVDAIVNDPDFLGLHQVPLLPHVVAIADLRSSGIQAGAR